MDGRPLSLMGSLEFVGGGAAFLSWYLELTRPDWKKAGREMRRPHRSASVFSLENSRKVGESEKIGSLAWEIKIALCSQE